MDLFSVELINDVKINGKLCEPNLIRRPILESVATLPHRICTEQIFYHHQGKGSRRDIYKSLIFRAFSPSPCLA